MATIHNWLTKAGFDLSTGVIILQEVEPDDAPGWSEFISAHIAGQDDPLLFKEFTSGFGSPRCPRFIAEDRDRLYFPSQYDGATSLVCVWKDIVRYLNIDTPYPGGG